MELPWIKKIEADGCYYVDKYGLVYNHLGERLTQTKCADGYLSVGIDGSRNYVHRLVAKYFIPNPNNLPCVNHKDGNKQNNRVDNLEWCTHSENTLHSFRTGLQKTNRWGKVRKYVDQN